MVDTEWPAEKPAKTSSIAKTQSYRARLTACIIYLADDARKNGFAEVSDELCRILSELRER